MPYHFQFEVTAGYPPADVQWTVTYGLLPYGLTLSSGGLLSGTPAPSTVARSPYSFQVLAEDKKCQPYFPQAGDQFNSAPFSIAVEPNAITTRADLRVFVNAEADAYDQVGAGFRRGSKFVVKVQNRGPDNAHQVEVLFEWSADAGVRSLPAGAKPVLTFRLYRCKETGQSAICTVPSIARGHSESIEILLGFGIGASYPRGVVREVVRLRASAKADEPDPRPSNNCRQVSITVFPSKPGQPGTPEGC